MQETLTQDENRLREIDQQLATLEAELRVYEERKDRCDALANGGAQCRKPRHQRATAIAGD
ncbi:MAG UNVERIFIED_CONTAM: hypothetical protein LVT10_19175 [Anaerolineae bacterium]